METVMIRYGELFLKSEPVMRYFIRNLLRNTKRALESEGLAHRFEIHRGRILIHGDEPHRIAEIAGRIFGIVEVAVCRMTGNTLEEISETAVDLASSHLQKGETFAVRARRQGVKGITSQELGARLGSVILDACPGVLVDLRPAPVPEKRRQDAGRNAPHNCDHQPGGLFCDKG